MFDTVWSTCTVFTLMQGLTGLSSVDTDQNSRSLSALFPFVILSTVDKSVTTSEYLLYVYRIYPKYSNTSTPYHTCSNIWTSTIYYPMLCQNCLMSGKQCRPWWDAAFCGVSSGSTLFAPASLSEYLRLIRYSRWQSQNMLIMTNLIC